MFRQVLILIFCLYGGYALSQTCCSAGAPLSNLITVDNTDQQFSFTLGYEYKGINLLVDNNQRLVNDPRSRSGQNVSLKTDYVLNEHWAFSLSIPLIFQSRSTSSDEQTSIGLGDISLISQYKLLQKNDLSIFLAGGIELPTGLTGHTSTSSIFLSPDMQSGSGTFDLLIGASLFYDKLFTPALSTSLEFLYKRNGTNENFAGTDTFSGRRFGFGHETLAALGLSYQLVHRHGFFTPDLTLKYRRSTPNREQFVEAPNSGGFWVSLPLGLSFQPDVDKSIRVFAELPIYQELSGLQITTSFTFGVQFRYSIQNEKINQKINL